MLLVAAALAVAVLTWWAVQRASWATPVSGAAARRQADLTFAAAVVVTLTVGVAAVFWLLEQADQVEPGKERAALQALAKWTASRRELAAAQRALHDAAADTPHTARQRQLWQAGRLTDTEWQDVLTTHTARHSRERSAIARAERDLESARQSLHEARVELNRLSLSRQAVKANVLDERRR